MAKGFFQTAEKLNKEHKRSKRWHKVITVMAAVVVFCTTYALILPAITWERSLMCDMKEHTHTDACYSQVEKLAERQELVCTKAEHTHGDSCYEEIERCVCGLEEDETHQHTADCMEVERVLICEQAEHAHDGDCYHAVPAEAERQLTCGKTEHVHTDACYDAPPTYDSGYYCGHVAHKHNKNCYYDDGSLRCTLKEHEHTVKCQIDNSADVENAADWEATFADVKLGKNWTKNVLAIADSQLGYTESSKNFQIAANGDHMGYSRYGAWYGVPYGDWCAMFASFCIDYAGVKDFPLDSNCGTWIEALADGDTPCYHFAHSALESYVPRPGDLIFLDWDATEAEDAADFEALTDEQLAEMTTEVLTQAVDSVDHVGIVYEVIGATEDTPAQVKTIEGNNGNVVAYHTYNLDDVQILGYGTLPQNPDYLKVHEIKSAPASDGAVVTISGNMPTDAKAVIKPVKMSEKQLNTYVGEDKAAAINSYIAYDIKIMVDGEEWQPETPVSVKIDNPSLEVKRGEGFAVTHVDDVTQTASEVSQPVDVNDTIAFTADGFSTYIFYTFTVDFHYGDVVFSIAGRTEITLSELFNELGITRSAEDVVDVTFSDASLVRVEQTENDWLLTSLEPFSSNETLTITFNDGEVYVLSVTDAQSDTSYWQKVADLSDITTDDQYMIVSSSGYALGTNGYSFVGTQVTPVPQTVNGETYYTVTGDTNTDNYRWQFGAGSNGGALKNVGAPNGSFPMSNTNNTLQDRSDDTWRISYTTGNWIWQTTNYLVCNNGTFTTGTGANNANMTIYKLVDKPNPDPGGGDTPGGSGLVTKPTYDPYIDPSGAKTGTTSSSGVDGKYYSDPATSQLESLFTDKPADDGKVMTDKSVIYGGDDYNAFDSYDKNTFGVTLSALGQKYMLNDELQVEVPLDVVFVLDTSGSMIDSKYNGVTNAYTMIQSLNSIMDYILDENPDNRVGVVCFSGQSEKLLDLGRYTATNNQFFNADPWRTTTSTTIALSPSNSIQRTDGTLYKGTFDHGWWGTYTQHGIAQGAQEFLDVAKKDTTVTRVATGEVDGQPISANYTVTRQPVIILLSDGDPTYCTKDYTNVLQTTNIYGDGTSTAINDQNNQGVMGYYTILSAQHYKQQISQHYGTDAYFYSIGLGIGNSGSDSYSDSLSGDDYKRAVLNPSDTNIAAIRNCTNGTANLAGNWLQQRDIKGYSESTCHQLYNLLNDKLTAKTITVRHYDAANYGEPGPTKASVPVIKNPFKASGYAYADDAFFTTQATKDQLTNAFKDAISFSNNLPVYGFILRSNSSVTLTDPIGEGMEIKSEPILRYGGVNYAPSSVETDGNLTTYHYSGTYTATDGSGQTADLSQIRAEVYTDDAGKQTVKLNMPDAMVPAYSPELDNAGTPNFYYESLPVRLLYQVGLTDEAQADIAALKDTGGDLEYYTNAWSDSDYAYATFSPTSKNPYYAGNTYDKTSSPKTGNTTNTSGTSRAFSSESDAQNVGQLLGNNGKLTFHADEPPKFPVTIRKVNMFNQVITSDTAKFALYKDAALTQLVGTYSTDSHGELTIPDLYVGKTYYLKETKAPDGYNALAETMTFSVDATGKVVGIGSESYLSWNSGKLLVRNSDGYELPESGGIGLIPIYTLGAMLMAGAFVCGYFLRRKAERRHR